jgi:hypothetical protein
LVGGVVTVTVAVLEALPPDPVHVRGYPVLAVRARVVIEPLVDWLPLHPPDATQLVAFVLLQVKVLGLPVTTEAGVAMSETVGVAGTGAELEKMISSKYSVRQEAAAESLMLSVRLPAASDAAAL